MRSTHHFHLVTAWNGRSTPATRCTGLPSDSSWVMDGCSPACALHDQKSRSVTSQSVYFPDGAAEPAIQYATSFRLRLERNRYRSPAVEAPGTAQPVPLALLAS